MGEVFLSYAASDRQLADALVSELQARKISVWYDAYLDPNKFRNLADAVYSRVRRAEKVLLLWSADAARSKSTMTEARMASKMGKLVVATIDDVPLPGDLGLFRYVSSPSNSAKELADMLAANALLTPQTSPPKAEPKRNRGFAFLSYAEEDFSFVEQLRKRLTDERFLFWEYSSGDRDIEKLLYLELESKINDSVVVICVVSPSWKRAIWPAREYFYSKEIARPVFIVECQELEPTLAIAGEHRIRAWGAHLETGLELLSRELRRRGL